MLTLSVVWVFLAAAVTVAAMRKRSVVETGTTSSPQSKEMGTGLTILALVSSAVLIAGFAVVGKFLVTGL
jgi:hypothetical protein